MRGENALVFPGVENSLRRASFALLLIEGTKIDFDEEDPCPLSRQRVSGEHSPIRHLPFLFARDLSVKAVRKRITPV